MAYSVDLRKKAMAYRETHTQEETAKTFDVSVSAVRDWEQLQRETGSLDKKPLERKWRKIDPEKLCAYVAEHPDKYLDEIAATFECSDEAIRLALKKHKITRKKNDKIP